MTLEIAKSVMVYHSVKSFVALCNCMTWMKMDSLRFKNQGLPYALSDLAVSSATVYTSAHLLIFMIVIVLIDVKHSLVQ